MKIGDKELYQVEFGPHCEDCVHLKGDCCEILFHLGKYDREDVNFFNIVYRYVPVRNKKNPCNHSRCDTIWWGLSPPVMPQDTRRYSLCESVNWVLFGKCTDYMNINLKAIASEHAFTDPRAALYQPIPRALLSDSPPRLVHESFISNIRVQVWAGDICLSTSNAIFTTSGWTFYKLSAASGEFKSVGHFGIEPGEDSILSDNVRLINFKATFNCTSGLLQKWLLRELDQMPNNIESVAMTGLPCSFNYDGIYDQIVESINILSPGIMKLELWDFNDTSEWLQALARVSL